MDQEGGQGGRPEEEVSARQVRMLTNQGARLLAAGRAQEALDFLEEAHRAAPDEVAVCINLGSAYILLGKHRQAIPLLELAVVEEPENPMVWVNLAAAYLGNPVLATSEQQERAIEALRQSVALDPATPHAYYNLGLIYKDREEWQKALDDFGQAVVVNPQDRDASGWMARIEEMMAAGQEDDA